MNKSTRFLLISLSILILGVVLSNLGIRLGGIIASIGLSGIIMLSIAIVASTFIILAQKAVKRILHLERKVMM